MNNNGRIQIFLGGPVILNCYCLFKKLPVLAPTVVGCGEEDFEFIKPQILLKSMLSSHILSRITIVT